MSVETEKDPSKDVSSSPSMDDSSSYPDDITQAECVHRVPDEHVNMSPASKNLTNGTSENETIRPKKESSEDELEPVWSKNAKIPRVEIQNGEETIDSIPSANESSNEMIAWAKIVFPESSKAQEDEKRQKTKRALINNFLRLKPSQELINQNKMMCRNGVSQPIRSNNANGAQNIEHNLLRSVSHPEGEKIRDLENSSEITKEGQEGVHASHLRVRGGPESNYSQSGPLIRRSRSIDSHNIFKEYIQARQRKLNAYTNNKLIEQYKRSSFWDRKLLSYLSPRLNHPLSRTTHSKPILAKDNAKGKSFLSCTIWIHLQVSHASRQCFNWGGEFAYFVYNLRIFGVII